MAKKPEDKITDKRAKEKGDGDEAYSSMAFYDENGSQYAAGRDFQKPNPPMIPVEGEIKLPG